MKGVDSESKLLVALWSIPVVFSILLLLKVLVPSFTAELNFANERDFIEAIKNEEWRVLYSDPKPDLERWQSCKKDVSCPGNPNTGALFSAGAFRGENHYKTTQKLRGSRYWLGRVFPKEKVAEWRAKGATQILVGYFYGSYEVFLNGERQIVRDGVTSRSPLAVELPLSDSGDFFVAIRLLHDMDEPYPDVLVAGALTPLQLEKHLRDAEFQQLVKPALAVGFSAGLGFLFLLLWLAAWKRMEYAAFSAYAFLQAAGNSLLIPFVWLHTGNHLYHRIYFFVSWYQGLAILFIGLTMARLRTWYATIALLILLVAPWFSLLTDWRTDQFYENSLVVYRVFQSFAYLMATSILLLQARLVARKRGELLDPYREHKLYICAAVLVSMAIAQWVADAGSLDIRVVYNEVVISILAIAMAHEYRRQSNFVSKSPVSKYHQFATELSELHSYVISLDLKNSEALFRIGSEQGLGSTLVKKLILKFSQLANDRGAELISSEGDSLILFLPVSEDSDESLRKALSLCFELKMALKAYLLEEKLSPDFELRIALQEGKIRPIWHELGGRKFPGWEQVGESTVFVDLARMLEAEAKVLPRSCSSLVLMPKLTESVKKLQPALLFQQYETTIKHGRRLSLHMAKLS